MALVNGGKFIGRVAANDTSLDGYGPAGIVTPRSENFTIELAEFYNYNWGDAAAINSANPSENQVDGMFTVTVTNLQFHPDTVDKRVK